MRISLQQLKKYRVETKSGVYLGRVVDIVMQTDGQTIVQYIIHPSLLSTKQYTISREQVVTFEEGVMVVDDSVSSEKETPTKEEGVDRRPEPVVMRKTMN